VWLQPVAEYTDGTMLWGVASAMPIAATPSDKKPANITLNFQTPKERTVKLKATHTYKFAASSNKKPVTHVVEVNILEIPGKEGGAITIRTAYGALKISTERDGVKTPLAKDILDLVYQLPNTYLVSDQGKWASRTGGGLPPSTTKEQREAAYDEQFHISEPLDAVMLPMPNSMKQPGDSWDSQPDTQAPIIFRVKGEDAQLNLLLNSTYEGLKTNDGRTEAIISIRGALRAIKAKDIALEGIVVGTIGFDSTNGFISSAQMRIASAPNDDKDTYSLDIEMTRVPGNPTGIKLPDAKNPDPVAKGKNILDKKDNVSFTDKFDPTMSMVNPKMKKLAHYKEYPIILQQGKKYNIKLETTSFDPCVKVLAPNGSLFAGDGKIGGGPVAQVNIPVQVSGTYRIYAIAFPGRTGNFHLTVTEVP
jgi:hypothetical protein